MRSHYDSHHNNIRIYSSKCCAFILLVGLFLSLFLGCAQSDSIFPHVSDESTIPSDTEMTETTLPSDYYSETPTLIIAAPMTQETADYLVRLYYLKNNDLLGEGVSGSSISLSYLSGIEPDFRVEVLTTSGSGATSMSVESWKSDDMMPDILLPHSMSKFVEEDELLLLNDYVASNPLLSPSNTYINMIDHLKYDADIYGVPYSASADVVFVNTEWIDPIQDEPLPFELSTVLLADISNRIMDMNLEEELEDPVLPFFSVSQLIPNMLDINSICAQIDDDMDLSTLDDEGLEGLLFLRSYASAYFSTDLMDQDDIDEWFGSMDPILSNRVVMWAGHSNDVTRWANRFPYSISMVQPPSFETDQVSPPNLTVYPLCVSADTPYPNMASDFATFIALDEDAIMLRMRLEVHEGYIPVVKEKRVWDACFAHMTYSSSLYMFREYMDQASFSNQMSDHVLDEQIKMAIQKYGLGLIDSNENFNEYLVSFVEYLMTG